MNTEKLPSKIRWKRVLLILAVATPVITFPLWHRLLFPSFYSQSRCLFTDASGEVRKGHGILCEGIDQ